MTKKRYGTRGITEGSQAAGHFGSMSAAATALQVKRAFKDNRTAALSALAKLVEQVAL